MSVNNIIKTLTYIYPISKQCITYNMQKWEPVTSIVLRESLFCKDECLVCSRCCIPENNIFLPFEVDNMYETLNLKDIDTRVHKLNGKGYKNIEELLSALKSDTVCVNDKEYKIFSCSLPHKTYYFVDRGILKRCHWSLPTEDGRLGCGIHSVEALTCRMPHIRFFYNKEKRATSISHSAYGRNWALKCPAQISKTEFSVDTVNTVISNFELLNKYCDYFEIETWCPEILELLYAVRDKGAESVKAICDKNIIQKGVLF